MDYGFSPPVWTVSTGLWSRGKEYELSAIKGRTLTLRLDGPDSSSFSLYGDSQDAQLVTELEDDVWWQRNGEILHRGRILTSSDSVGDEFDVTFGSESYEALLDRRLLHLVGPAQYSYISFPDVKPTDIIKWLIQHAESQTGMRLGLTFGQWSDLGIPSVEDQQINVEAIKFEDGTKIYSAIKTLLSIAPDFEFWVGPDLKCNVARPRGSDKDIILDYGGVISDFSRSFGSEDFADVIRQTGAAPLSAWYPKGLGEPSIATHIITSERHGTDLVVTKGSTTVTSAAANFAATDPGKNITISGVVYRIASQSDGSTAALERNYEDTTGASKVWSIGSIVVNPAPPGLGTYSTTPAGGWVDERADTDMLAQRQVDLAAQASYEKSGLRRRYSYSATFGPNMWRGPSHVAVGDYVWFVAKRGRIDVRIKLRVTSLTIAINEEGEETVSVTLDLAKDHQLALKNFRDLVRRLAKKK